MKQTPLFKSTSHYGSYDIFCTPFLQALPLWSSPFFDRNDGTHCKKWYSFIDLKPGKFQADPTHETRLKSTFPAPLRWYVHHCVCILWRDRRPLIKDLVKLRGRWREAIKSSLRFSVSLFAVLRKIRIEMSKVLVFEERVSRQLLIGVFTVVAVIVLWSPNRGYWDITVKCQEHGELWTGKSIGGLV